MNYFNVKIQVQTNMDDTEIDEIIDSFKESMFNTNGPKGRHLGNLSAYDSRYLGLGSGARVGIYHSTDGCGDIFNIDTSTNIPVLYIFWKNPKNDLNLHTRITFNKFFKLAKIKRIITKIDDTQFQLKKIIHNGYIQLSYIKSKLSLPLNEIHIKSLKEQFIYYYQYYNNINNYYNNLSNYCEKYTRLINIYKGDNICYECLKVYSEYNDKKYAILTPHPSHSRFKICKQCEQAKKYENAECPICLDKILSDQLYITNCAGKHTLCQSCYKTYRQFSDKCPMCRGTL